LKKIFSIALVLILLAGVLALPISVSAASSPWETSGTKFNVFEDLSAMEDSANKAASAGCNLYIKDGKIVLDKNNTAWHARIFDLAAAVDANKADGFGFYAENNTSTAQYIIPRFYIGSKYAGTKPGAAVYMYNSATETVEQKSISQNRPVTIPSGFKGFIAIPFESIDWTRNEAGDHIGKSEADLKSANELKITKLGFVAGGVNLDESSGEQLIMDNFFMYGKNVTEKNNGVIPVAVKSNDDIINDNIEIIADDMKAFTKVTPKVTYHSQYDAGTAKAITYEGASIGGKPTKVFAYIGYPANMDANKKYPAVVLIHGGGGHAFPDWVKKWTAQGYIAIAMDNTGFFPTSANNNPYNATNWVWGLDKSPFAESGYGNVPQCDSYNSLMQSPDRQWMYHAVAQAILAKGVLEADANVDASKIGVVGISWGSKVTACVIGYEKFAFAVCQYVAGHLEYAQNHNQQYSTLTGYKQWKADRLFKNVDYPVLFQQWTYDSSASIKSTSKCYEDLMPEGAIMSLRTSWSHGHDWNTPIETYRFADSIVKGGKPMTTFTSQPDGSRFVDCQISVPSDATKVTAKVQYVTEKLTYKNANGWKPEQTFKTAELTVKDGRVSGKVPADAVEFYVEITTVAGGKTYYTASLYKTVDKNADPCKNGHSYVGGKCERCDAKQPESVTATPSPTPTPVPEETTPAPVESPTATTEPGGTSGCVITDSPEGVTPSPTIPDKVTEPAESATVTEPVETKEPLESPAPTQTQGMETEPDNTVIYVVVAAAVAVIIAAVVVAIIYTKKG